MRNRFEALLTLVFICLFVIAGQGTASAQGRGVGRGQGGPPAGGPSRGQPPGIGVDRGINTSSESSKGRADSGRATASERSNGRSDIGLNRARLQRENAQRANEELKDHPQMAARLKTTANDLRSGYRAALLANPNLKFGQYVAATRLGSNLSARRPRITTNAILLGIANGESIGRTLQDFGLSKEEAKEAKKKAEREIKEAKRQ